MAPTRKLTGLPVGTKWEGIHGDTYEVTGFYTVTGKNYYHIKLNGNHIQEGDGSRSTRLIPEEEVKRMREDRKK